MSHRQLLDSYIQLPTCHLQLNVSHVSISKSICFKPKSYPNLPLCLFSKDSDYSLSSFLDQKSENNFWPSFSLTLMSRFSPLPMKLTSKILKSPTFQLFIELILSQDSIIFFSRPLQRPLPILPASPFATTPCFNPISTQQGEIRPLAHSKPFSVSLCTLDNPNSLP